MASLTRFVERRLDKQVSALGLGVFRIAWGCVLFLEVAQLYYFRHFFFDPVPYVIPATPDMTLVFLLWLAVIVCLIAGFLTRTAAIANYAFTLATLSRFTTFEYHHDYIVIGVNFLLVFVPVGRRLSVDRWIELRRRLGRQSSSELPATVSVLAYEIPVFVGIALVYFDSAVYKIFSPMWIAGLGLWQPASAPYAVLFEWSWLLDQQFLVKALGLLVILFEATFVFLMWNRRARVPLLILGIGFHLGILLVFALPLFALGVVSLFLLLVPAGWWEASGQSSGASPAEADRASVVVRRPQKLAVFAITGFLVLTAVSQGLCLFESPPLVRRTEALRRTSFYQGWRTAARFFLGIHPHAVFMDSRYGPYDWQFAVVYVDRENGEIWLPVVTPRGHASYYSTGRLHVYWTHRVNGARLQPNRMARGIRRLTAFWAHEHGIDLQDAVFEVRVRRLLQSEGWEAGLLQRQYRQPWVRAGTAKWSDGEFALDMTGRAPESRAPAGGLSRRERRRHGKGS